MPTIRSRYEGSNKTPPHPVPFTVTILFPEPTPLALTGTKLLTLVKDPETWEAHFTSRGWNSIQDQLALGYSHYAHPCPLSGTYDEVFDFGVVITNSIISVNFSRADIVGDVDIAVKIAASLVNNSFPPLIAGSSLFHQAFRYVYVQLLFTELSHGAFGGIDLTVLNRLTVSVSVKELVDSGSFFANSAHASPGTSQAFNKAFKDINSLTATVESTNEPYEVVISWVDAPNPTIFSVMVFDTAGNRVSKQVSWKARGVI